jgi:hypothetical protein
VVVVRPRPRSHVPYIRRLGPRPAGRGARPYLPRASASGLARAVYLSFIISGGLFDFPPQFYRRSDSICSDAVGLSAVCRCRIEADRRCRIKAKADQ